MKRLMLVSDAWYPQVNGVVTVLQETKTILEQREWEVLVVHPLLFRNVPLPSYPEIRLALLPRRKFKVLLDEYQPHAVHIATEGPVGWAARKVLTKKSIPFTTSYHTHFPLYIEARLGRFEELAYRYLRRFHARADRVMVATPTLMNELAYRDFTRMTLWPLGVDTERFKPTSTGGEEKEPVFAYVGRVAVEKNIEEFLEGSYPGRKVVIGDGPDRKKLEKKYGGTVEFVGYKRGSELVEAIGKAQVVVMPSRTETFGLVILEALACGVPVAAHKVMGPQDILTQGKDGFCDDDLVAAATACLGLSPNDCRAKALEYSWSSSVDHFLSNIVVVDISSNS